MNLRCAVAARAADRLRFGPLFQVVRSVFVCCPTSFFWGRTSATVCCTIISSSSVGMIQAEGAQTDREAIGIDRLGANPKRDQTSLHNALSYRRPSGGLKRARPWGRKA